MGCRRLVLHPLLRRTGLALLLSIWGAQAQEFHTPTVTAAFSPGTLDMEKCAWMLPFLAAGETRAARRRTRFGVTWDRQALHVAINPNEPDAAGVWLAFRRGRPEHVRDGDSVSMFLRVGELCYEFSVACDGSLSEVRWGNGRPDSDWSAAATWTVERPNEWLGRLRIPWDGLDITNPAAAATFELAFRRRAAMVGELSGWPGCRPDQPLPANWGCLVLGAPDGPFTSQFIMSRLQPGTGKIVYWLRPDGSKADISVLAAARETPYRLPLAPTYEGSGGGWWAYGFTVAPGVPVKLQAVLRSAGQVLHATAIVPVPMPVMSTEVGAAVERVKNAAAAAAALPQSALRTELIEGSRAVLKADRELLSGVRRALAAPPDQRYAETLGRYAERTETALWRSHLLVGRVAALRHDAAAPGFAVGTTHSVVKLRRFDTDLTYGEPLRLRGARRERESGQIVIVPFLRDLAAVTAAVTPLLGEGGIALGPDTVQLERVGYVKTTTPEYDVQYVGWWPDPLLPNAPFEVSARHTQPLWLTAYVPPGAAAGVYRGSVRIAAGDAGALTVPVELEVLDYDLPLRGRLRTIFGMHWNGALVSWYGWDEAGADGPGTEEYKNIPQAWARQIWDMTLAYRIYAGGLYEQLPFPRREDLDFCLERGLNNYQIGMAQSSGATKDPDEFLPRLREMAACARDKDIIDMCYFYGWDEYAELSEEHNRHFLKDFGAAKREVPEIARCDVYRNPSAEVMDVLDIVVPLTPALEQRTRWEHWRKQGKTIGAYVCCGPQHPYANFFIDYPAIDQRLLFWQLFDYDVTFFLYYAINTWRQSDRPGQPRWPDAPWVTASHGTDNGDGHLLYPGKDAVLPSVRLANIRDGIEDYEALAVLEALTARLDRQRDAQLIAENQALLAVPDDLTVSLTEYTQDPSVLLRARRRLDAQILKTRQARDR